MTVATPRTPLLVTLVALLSVMAVPDGALAKGRTVVVLPFSAPAEPDAWFGDGIADTMYVAFQTSPLLLPVSRTRVVQALRGVGADPQGSVSDSAAVAVGRALKAELVLHGDYQRTPDGGMTITPRWIDVARGSATALEPIQAAPGKLVEAPAQVAQAYIRALKLVLKPDEVQRLTQAARPSASLTAFEAFAKARRSALRGTQEGNEGAAELLARAVEVDPSFGLAHYHLGIVHLALGNRWKAAAQFRAATQVDASLPEPFKALGDLFMQSPRRLYDQAIEAYQKALVLRPHFAEAQVGLGDAKAAKNDFEGAIGHYQKALGVDPQNARVHFSLGKIYYNEKNLYYEAVTAYKKAIELDQYFLEARMGLGEIYEEKGLYQDAIAEYKKVIETEAKHTAAHYNLALAYEKVDPREAIVQWERYIALAAQSPTEKDWIDVARQHLKKLKDKYPQP